MTRSSVFARNHRLHCKPFVHDQTVMSEACFEGLERPVCRMRFRQTACIAHWKRGQAVRHIGRCCTSSFAAKAGSPDKTDTYSINTLRKARLPAEPASGLNGAPSCIESMTASNLCGMQARALANQACCAPRGLRRDQRCGQSRGRYRLPAAKSAPVPETPVQAA